MTRVLVVGASGFLGQHVVRALAAAGHEVTATYRDPAFGGFPGVEGVTAIRHDLLKDERRWEEDVCVYLAGNSHHGRSLEDPLTDLEQNTVGLLRFLRGFSGAIVLFSSAAVYEGHEGAVGPATPVSPVFPYAVSKLAGEAYVRHHQRTEGLRGYLILRLYYAFGPGERRGRLFEALCRKGLLGGERKFEVSGAGDSLLDPLYVEDVAACAVKSIDHATHNRVFDLCAGWPTPVRSLITRVGLAQGVSLEVVHTPPRPEIPVRFFSDPQPLRKALGLPEPTPLQESVGRYLGWMKERLTAKP